MPIPSGAESTNQPPSDHTQLAPISPEPPKSKRKFKILGGLIAVLFIGSSFGILFFTSIDGPSVQTVNRARSLAPGKVAEASALLQINNPIVNTSQDEYCSTNSVEKFSHVSYINCKYNLYIFTYASGDKIEKLSNLDQKLKAGGYKPDGPSALDPGAIDFFDQGTGYINNDGTTALDLFIFTNNEQLRTTYQLLNVKDTFKNIDFGQGYLIGAKITNSYVQFKKCIICINQFYRGSIPFQGSHIAEMTPINFSLYRPTYTLPSYNLRVTSLDNSNIPSAYIFYDYQDKEGGLDLIEFKKPSYYDPPKICGTDSPSGSEDACELLLTPRPHTSTMGRYEGHIYGRPKRPTLFKISASSP